MAERKANEAELVKGDAEYVNSDSGPRLEVTDDQIEGAKNEMNKKSFRKTQRERISNDDVRTIQKFI